MEEYIDKLRDHIPIGKDKAIHLNELAERLGVTPSYAKKKIQEARREGKGSDIVSGSAGYWIAESEEERKAFENMLRKQAITRLKTTKPIRDSLKDYKGQMSLTDTLKEGSEGGGKD